MSTENTDRELKAAKDDVLKAVQCLFLEVHDSIADDVKSKITRLIAAYESRPLRPEGGVREAVYRGMDSLIEWCEGHELADKNALANIKTELVIMRSLLPPQEPRKDSDHA